MTRDPLHPLIEATGEKNMPDKKESSQYWEHIRLPPDTEEVHPKIDIVMENDWCLARSNKKEEEQSISEEEHKYRSYKSPHQKIAPESYPSLGPGQGSFPSIVC